MPNDDNELEQQITPAVRTLQVIVAALCMGPIIFAAVVLIVIKPPAFEESDLMSRFAMLAGLGMVLAQSVVSGFVANQGVKEWAGSGGEVGELSHVHQIRTIIACALCEAGAFFNLIVYGFLNADPWNLAMAGLLVAVTATRFPTVAGVADWCRNQARNATF
ncbi:MAG: hypothetical protein AAGB00_03360 [Planctomycetota bacterium]